MKYAIARYYIDNFIVYECLDGNLYCLESDWECFMPNIAEPTDNLHPIWQNQIAQVNFLKQLQKQPERKLPHTALRVVSATEQIIYLAADFPLAKIHTLSKEEFESISEEQALSLLCENEPRKPIAIPPIGSKQYPAFLKFLVFFRQFSAEQILTLYAYSAKEIAKHPEQELFWLSNFKTVGDWIRQGYRISREMLQFAIPLDISVSQSFFLRGKKEYPVEYALHSERTAIAIGTLSLTETIVSSCLLVLSSRNFSKTVSYPPRDCDAKLFFDSVSKLACTQGIQVKCDTNCSKPFYQNGTIRLPPESNERKAAQMLCREYAAAVCDKTCIVSDTQTKDLYADSLAYMLAYRYGLEDTQTAHLSEVWNAIGNEIDLPAFTYLHNALLHIDSRISPKLFPMQEELQQLESNLLSHIPNEQTSNRSKFKNLSETEDSE